MSRPNREDFFQFGRGLLMGGADIIPGVSGGTVALVVGIYERLVSAISHFDVHLLRLLKARRWSEAARHVDLRFLLALGLGILTGIVSLAELMQYLLFEQRSYTLAVFFGLILASSWIVARMARPRGFAQYGLCGGLAVGSALLAYWLVGLSQLGFHEHLGYFFLCGMVAICAMILPGISGAYILWLLGAYVALTEMISHVKHLEFTASELNSLLVFCAGCVIGLVSFSKLLRRLLTHAHMPTMAVLGGFMVGSLRGMWPFQIDLTPDEPELKLKQFESFVPVQWDSEVTTCLALALTATVVILVLEWWGTRLADRDA